MNYISAVDKILSFEKIIDYGDFVYKGINFWPLFRLHLWREFTKQYSRTTPKKKIDNKQSGGNNAFKNHPFYNNFRYIVLGFINNIKIGITSHKDFLFVSRDMNLVDIGQKRYIDKINDPVMQLLGIKKCSKLKILLDDEINPNEVNKSLKLRFLPLNKEREAIYRRGLTKFISGNIANYKLPIRNRSLYSDILQIIEYRNFFLKYLKLLNPKIVFMSCYYSPENYGLSLACADLKIKSAELQHGKQGKFNALYSYWKAKSKTPFNLIPSYFLLWGEDSRKNIIQHSSKHFIQKHKPFVIGYPWISDCKKGLYNKFLSQKYNNFLKSLSKYNNVVLITLQPVPNPLPVFLIKTLNKLFSNNNSIVLIRFHPAMENYKKEIINKNKNKITFSYEYEKSSDLPLPMILSKSTIHITGFSSTAYEALSFNLATIMFHNSAKFLYKKELGQKSFILGTNHKTLEKGINSQIRKRQKRSSKYILTDNRTIKANLKKFLKSI